MAITFLKDLMAASSLADTRVSGCLGPRGDGYRPDTTMPAHEARRQHAAQVEAFAGAGADVALAATLTHVGEAAGIALAASDAGLPVVLSFTVETDGRLPDGTPLGQAIQAVDDATDGYADRFMVNCAHPDHVYPGLDPGEPWVQRIGALRGNASRMSHAELDEAEELDAGDPDDFAASHLRLRDALPQVEVLGGCCGTDARHIRSLVAAWGVLPA
jgi:homocysteine S-methyltransferase